jgi:hypothetical protein
MNAERKRGILPTIITPNPNSTTGTISTIHGGVNNIV